MSRSPARLVISPKPRAPLRRKGPLALEALVSPERKPLFKQSKTLNKLKGRKSLGSQDSDDREIDQQKDILTKEIEFLKKVEERYGRVKSLEQELSESRALAQRLRTQVNWFRQSLSSLSENCNDELFRSQVCRALRSSLAATEPGEDLFQLIQKTAECLETWQLRVNI